MTSKFRDIAAKHRERRMRVRRREMAFAASQANNNNNMNLNHHRHSLPTGQVVSHCNNNNPHDVDVCSSISVSSYSTSKDDGTGFDDDITNETFGETISDVPESVEEDYDSSKEYQQQQQQHQKVAANNFTKRQHHVATAAAAAYRRKGRSPMLVKKKATTPKINVPSTSFNNNNNTPRGGGTGEQKMTSPSWANVKLKKSSNNNSGNEMLGIGEKKNVATAEPEKSKGFITTETTAATVKVLAPKTRGGSGGGGSGGTGTGSSCNNNNNNNNNKQRVVRAATTGNGGSRRRFKSSYTDRPAAIVQSPKMRLMNTSSPRMMGGASPNKMMLRQTGNTSLWQESISPPPPIVDKTTTTPLVEVDDNDNNDFYEEKKDEEEENVVVVQETIATTTIPSSSPPAYWSIKLKKNTATGKKPTITNRPNTTPTVATATATATADTDMMMIKQPSENFQQGQDDTEQQQQQQPPSRTTTTTSTTTSASNSSSSSCNPPPVWPVKLKSTKVTHARPVLPEMAPITTTFTTDVQSPKTSVSSSKQQQVSGKTSTTTTSHWTAPAADAKKRSAVAASIVTTNTVTTTTFTTLASPPAAMVQITTHKPVELTSPPAEAWAQHKLKKTGFDYVTEETDKPAIDEPVTEEKPTAGIVVSTLKDDDNDKKPQKSSVVLAWAQKKWEKQNVVAAKVEEQDPVTTTPLDNDKSQQRQSAPPPAWKLRKLRSSIENEVMDQDKHVTVIALTPKTDVITTLTPKIMTASVDDEKNSRRSIRSPLAAWVQSSNKARNAAVDNEHDQAQHDYKSTLPTPRSSSTEQDQSKMTTSPLPPGASPLPVWAQISLKKTGIDVAEQHPLEKIINVETTKEPALDQQLVEKESSTPKVQISTNLTPKVFERFGGGVSGGPWNPTVNLPPWVQTALRNTATNMSDDSLVDENVQKQKKRPSALTVTATESNCQIVVPRAAHDCGDSQILTRTFTSISDAAGEKFSTNMAPWIRAKLKKKMGSDTTVEIWPEDECSSSLATSKSPAATATQTTTNEENHRGAQASSSSTHAWPIGKLRKTGLFNKEIDAPAAAPPPITPIIADSSITTKMTPTPMNGSNSKRQVISPTLGMTNRAKDCVDISAAESCSAPVPDIVALDVENEDQTTPPQNPWATMKLRKTGIEVVESIPSDELVMMGEKRTAKPQPTIVLTVIAPERRMMSIREATPRANTEETTPSAASVARAKTPDNQSNNNNRRAPWPIAMLKKTGFDVTDQRPPPPVESTDTVERLEVNNNTAKEAVILNVRRASVTPKNAVAPGKIIMERIDESEPVNNSSNPWSMLKLKKTGFDVTEEETISEPSLKAKDIPISSTVVDEPTEVNISTKNAAAKAVVAEPEQQEEFDNDESPASAEECDTGRQQQPVWAQLKLKKTGKAETLLSTPPDVIVSDNGKARHWKKGRIDVV